MDGADGIGLGWRTDLAVLRHAGSSVQDRGDHLVVRTPANPTYHWGNFVLVTDPGAVDDAARWRAQFAREFPAARHLAIGLVAEPSPEPWAGVRVEASDVLVCSDDLLARPLPEGYRARPLVTAEDWAASTALNDQHYPGLGEFARLRTESRRRMVAAGQLTWFGAFSSDDQLVSELGIAHVADDVARYQSVLTSAAHRRRGLTGHLLTVAAAHARSTGRRTLLIIADADSDAGRLYRAAGFRHTETAWQAYARSSS